MTGPDDTISITEAARRLGIHRHTLGRWIDTGKVSIVQIGTLRRIRVSTVDALVREGPLTDPGDTDG